MPWLFSWDGGRKGCLDHQRLFFMPLVAEVCDRGKSITFSQFELLTLFFKRYRLEFIPFGLPFGNEMSDFITQLKKAQRNVPVKEQVDAYYRLMPQINLAKDRNDMDSVLSLSLKSLEFLKALIKDTKKYSTSFDIITIPALEEGFFIAVVKGLRDQIENFKEVVSYYSELEPWKKKFETTERVVC
jgi:hypothetical protein